MPPSPQSPPTIALISKSQSVTQTALADFVGPYQTYINSFLTKLYPSAAATIVAPADSRVPEGAWSIHFLDAISQPGAAGYHSDSHYKPVAYIDCSQGEPIFTGSHELAEMLVDPQGNNLYTAPSPDPADDGKTVQILDELCDPCEDPSFSITVDGVQLSDFITPSFGNGTAAPYDQAGKLTAPREVAINGYISWIDDNVVKQATNFAPAGLSVRVLGQADSAKLAGKSLREWVDEQTREYLVKVRKVPAR